MDDRNVDIADFTLGSSLENYLVANQSLFKDVELNSIKSLLPQCQLQFLQEGEILIKQGEENHNLYLLLSGYLRVYISTSGKLRANTTIGFTIVPGECIGEMSIIENKPASAYVVGEEKCYLLVIPEQVFWEQLVCIPGVTKNLLQGLSLRIRQRDEIARQNFEQQLKFEYLQRDLAAARNIQSNILPHETLLFPNHPQVDVAAAITPAKEVGGDFFDAFPLDEDHIFIAVGDVSGKGIPAALFMIRVITLLRISVSRINPLPAIVESINRHLCEGNDDCMFVTMFMGIFEITSGKFYYVDGGHNLPFFARQNHQFQLLEVPKGMLLGIYEETQYQAGELVFQPGDTLVLYTDGVTEAEDQNSNFFSLERTAQVLNSLKGKDSKTIVAELQDRVAQFSTPVPQSDDITILVLRYLGN